MADSNLPIDIHTNKLLDWLISRRHCKKDYQASLDNIRTKIRLAIRDMPQIEEVTELLKSNVFDYYVCKRIVEILKSTDKDSKNIFGQYTSQRMIDWQEIVKHYEKDNTYLAEDAQTLIRNVNYEVPSLRKLSTKYEQQISDLERTIELCKKQARNSLNEYNLGAKKLGIEGNNIKQELSDQLEFLPKKLNELSKRLQALISVCDYYKTFLIFISQSEVDCLPILHYLLAKGNTTYYEYETGNVPERVEEFKLGFFFGIEDNLASEIDATTAVEDNTIDFGDGIDFGDDNTSSTDTPSTGNGDFVKLDKEEIEPEINWDISDESESVKCDSNNGGEQTAAANVARGQYAQSVLLQAQLRNRFINELLEVEFFLSERMFEMQNDNMLSSHLFQSAPSVLQLTSVDGIAEMLAKVNDIRRAFLDPSLKVLYYMKDNPKYIDNVFKKLNHLKIVSAKSLEKAAGLEKKRVDTLEELSAVGPQITEHIQRTKSLQQRIEDCISKKYNNRPVNIMGGVQTL